VAFGEGEMMLIEKLDKPTNHFTAQVEMEWYLVMVVGPNPGPSLGGCLWIIALVYDRNVDLIGVVGGSHAFGKDDFRYLDLPLRNFDVR
jgi:hypothetical protein